MNIGDPSIVRGDSGPRAPAGPGRTRRGVIEIRLSVVVPTRNEAGNVAPLREALSRSLSGIEHEIIVVDDSTDGVTRQVLRAQEAIDPPLRVI